VCITLDPLVPQLNALRSIGFENVDCFYKYGIFAMFGGSKMGRLKNEGKFSLADANMASPDLAGSGL
jgi:hypothetical protein